MNDDQRQPNTDSHLHPPIRGVSESEVSDQTEPAHSILASIKVEADEGTNLKEIIEESTRRICLVFRLDAPLLVGDEGRVESTARLIMDGFPKKWRFSGQSGEQSASSR